MSSFFSEARAFINNTPLPTGNPMPEINYKETTPEDFKPEPKPAELGEQKELCLYEGLEVEPDGAIIYYKDKALEVPDWFNKEMIKAQDKKTIDMVLIYYGIDFEKATSLRTLIRQ